MIKKIPKKSLCDEFYYEVVHDPVFLMSKIISNCLELNEKERYFLSIEVTQYRRFL